MSKKHLLILGGAALLGFFMADTLSNLPGLKQVANTASGLA